jgi:hypothetical protein
MASRVFSHTPVSSAQAATTTLSASDIAGLPDFTHHTIQVAGDCIINMRQDGQTAYAPVADLTNATATVNFAGCTGMTIVEQNVGTAIITITSYV